MSLDPQEEKLFMILQAIEQQGEQNKKTQNNIEQIAKTVTEQQEQLAKDRAEMETSPRGQTGLRTHDNAK